MSGPTWTSMPIKELYEGLYDGPHATPRPCDEGPVFLGIKNVAEDGHLDLSEIRHIAEDDYPTWTRRVEPRHGDIVFTYEATLNRYAIIPKGFHGCLGRRMALIRTNPRKVDTKFLFYYFFTDAWRSVIRSNTLIGSTVDRIPLTKFPEFPVHVPPLFLQHRIASILSAYDDLIENNQRRIKILEEMARSLYREWFVNFRFPGHEKVPLVDSPLRPIPKGWEVKTLGQICSITPGFAFKSQSWQESGVPVIKIKNIQSDNTVDINETDFVSEEIANNTPVKFALKHGEFLLAMTGATAGKIGRLRSRRPMLLNQRVAKILPRDGFGSFVWCATSSEESKDRFFRLADGAAQPNMSGSQIERITLTAPTMDLLNSFSKMTDAMLIQTDNLYLKNLNLRRARDLLLPKIISGELTVRHMDLWPEPICHDTEHCFES